MTFLNPLVLFGLVAAAIPLLVHFFNFRRPHRIQYSSLSFLRELRTTTMQRVRIKQWLLLLLRTLAIATLILAFARPTLQANLGGQGRTSMAIILDNSLSMTLRNAQGAYFEQARTVAAGLITDAQKEDEIFVLTTDGNQIDRQELETLDVASHAMTTSAALALAANSLEENASHPNKEIYFLGDLQRTTLLDTLTFAAPDDARVLLLPIGGQEQPNVSITNVRVVSRIVEAGQPVRIEATLVNYGTENLQGYVASLHLEGERLAQVTTDLSPSIPVQATFVITPQQRGWQAGKVEIEDDLFLHDNLRYFSLHVPEERRLLIVRGHQQEGRYIELALSSRLARGRAPFISHSIDESSLAATELESFDAVVLLGPQNLSSGEIASLTRYTKAGGGLLVFPSENVNLADYNALLQNLGGGRITGFSGAIGNRTSIATFSRVDLEHPLFDGVFDDVGVQERFEVERPETYYAMNYVPASGSEHTLIHLTNGLPFLAEVRAGQGAAFLVATAPNTAWSDLPIRGLFIPLLYRSIYYLSAAESVQGEQLVTGKMTNLRVTGVGDGSTVRIVTPEGEEYIPEMRTLFGATLLQIDGSLRQAGVYDIYAHETLVRRLALNVDREESNLLSYTGEEAAERLAEKTGAPVRAVQARENLLQSVVAERTGVELWNVFLLIALSCLVAEMLVSMRWRSGTADQP